MTVEPFTPVQRAGMDGAISAGYIGGDEIKVLTDQPGFGLTHVWFKEGYQLPLHSHDADCMYFIISGTIRIGTEELGPRDCFFVPADVPYAYKPGPDGVEVLEIRHANHFNFVNHAKAELVGQGRRRNRRQPGSLENRRTPGAQWLSSISPK